jgi:hypothetical protein
VREHHVEDDEVMVTLHGSPQTLGPFLRTLGLIAVKHEYIEKPVENGRIVLDYEYTGPGFSVGCHHFVGTFLIERLASLQSPFSSALYQAIRIPSAKLMQTPGLSGFAIL